MPSGKDGHHPGWKPLQGSANDRIPGWAPSPCRLPGPILRYGAVFGTDFHRQCLRLKPHSERQIRCAGQGVRGSRGPSVWASALKIVINVFLEQGMCMSMGMRRWQSSWGRAFQTQSRFCLLWSRAEGCGAACARALSWRGPALDGLFIGVCDILSITRPCTSCIRLSNSGWMTCQSGACRCTTRARYRQNVTNLGKITT